MLSQRFLLSRIAFIRLTESNYIYFILILDQPHRTNFTVAKVSNTSEGNCTIFNFKSESTKCKHTHNIYLFNSMELFIYQLLNQSEEEIRICNNSFLFENIKFAQKKKPKVSGWARRAINWDILYQYLKVRFLFSIYYHFSWHIKCGISSYVWN